MPRSHRVPCVGVVVLDDRGRLLLVRRANPPAQGTWSLPGGRVEPDESARAACRREVVEETGLQVTVGNLLGTVERAGPDAVIYAIADFAAEVTAGRLQPGDDASDAGWFAAAELAALDTSPGLMEALTGWGVLARPPASP